MSVLHQRKWSHRHCRARGAILIAADRTQLSVYLTHCCFTQDTPLTNLGNHSDPHLPDPFHLRGLPGSLLENMESNHKKFFPTWREGNFVSESQQASRLLTPTPGSCLPALLRSFARLFPLPTTLFLFLDVYMAPPSPPLRFLLRYLLHRKGFQDHPAK